MSSSFLRVLIVLALVACATLWVLGTTERDAEYAPRALGRGEASGAEAETARAVSAPADTAAVAVGTAVSERAALAEPTDAGASDVTLLDVRLVDATGAPVVAGALEWWAGPPDPERAGGAEHGRCAVSDAVTTIALSARCVDARLVASAPGRPLGEARVSRVRARADGTWQHAGLVRRDVEIALAERPLHAVVHGRVTVDGEPRVPADLRIELRSAPPPPGASVREVLAREPRVAAVDPWSARYRVGPTSEAMRALWVTSAETEPLHVPVPWPGSASDVAVDLACASGVTLALTCVDEAGAPVAGAVLDVLVLVRVETADREAEHAQEVWDGASRRTASGADGTCAVRGLARGATCRVRSAAEAERDPAEAVEGAMPLGGGRPLLELRVPPDGPATLERTVVVPRRAPARARAWGLVDEERWDAACADGAPRVRWCAREDRPHPDRHHTAAVADGAFEASVPVGIEHLFWLECGGRRVSEELAATAIDGRGVGPLVLAPRATRDVLLVWSDAPADATLEVTLVSAAGGERLLRRRLEAGPGEAELRLAGDATPDGAGALELDLALAGGARVLRRLALDGAALVEVDLWARAAAPAELAVEGVPGACELVLCALAEPAALATRATAAVRAGATAALPLPPGVYLARTRGLAGGDLCALLEVGAALTPRRIAWSGPARSLRALAGDGARGVVLETLGGRGLRALPVPLREFSFGLVGPGTASDAARDEPVRLPEECTFRSYR